MSIIRWAQSPGHDVTADRDQWPRLEACEDIVGTFGPISGCVWDLYNEPGNAILPLASLPPAKAIPSGLIKLARHFLLPSPSIPLLSASFKWARSVEPDQPLTVGIWAPNLRLNRLQLAQSDVISFHHYMGQKSLLKTIEKLKRRHQRPVLCTEWLARPVGSRVHTHLPVFQAEGVGCCWGQYRAGPRRFTVGMTVPAPRSQRSGIMIC